MKKKALVAFYSLTGNTRFIAETIRDTIDADLLEIKSVKEYNPKGMSKYLWGGMQAVMSSKPILESINTDPNGYDLIFLGTPVWAWNISPPMRSFLENFNLSGKDVAIWLCSGRKTKDTFKNFKALMKDVNIVGQMNFIDPLKKDTAQIKEKAIEWAKSKI